ncbi:hypothetical protein J5N97_012182 [Dioscorea zingiberensis]|uniref:Pectinesterase inhibitor domain-containing protein n=1 Tax=Dioscorea zingiberensis TaxID=325984 RepID=A0A9D5CND0_9LILI|nr:hypothetical protein J5N97_012182 [Dioscorea zingiberensis]
MHSFTRPLVSIAGVAEAMAAIGAATVAAASGPGKDARSHRLRFPEVGRQRLKHNQFDLLYMQPYVVQSHAFMALPPSPLMSPSLAQAKENINFITAMKDHPSSPQDEYVSSCIDDCLVQYGDAIDDLEQSVEALQQGKFGTMNIMVAELSNGEC